MRRRGLTAERTGGDSVRKNKDSGAPRRIGGDERKHSSGGILPLVEAFDVLSFLLLFLKTGSFAALGMAVAVPCALGLLYRLMRRRFYADGLLLALTAFLCSLGLLLQFRFDEGRGWNQALSVLLGMGAMAACILFVRFAKRWTLYAPLMMLGGWGLLLLPVLFGHEINGAKGWLTVGPVTFQPSEAVKLAHLCVTAYLLSRRKLVGAGVFSLGCLALLLLQRDLGTALLYYGVTLVMMYVSTGSLALGGIGLAAGAAGAVYGYTAFSHVKRRVAIWRNPWADPSGAGYQIVQSLIAIANGGLFGVGLGLGNASVIPYYYNDFVFSVLLNEFGGLFGLAVLGIYLLIGMRALMIARRADTVFDALLAVGCGVQMCLQTFVIVGGNIKLIPLTGVTLPLLSYGGTSMISSLCVLGLLQGVAARVEYGLERDRRLAGEGGK